MRNKEIRDLVFGAILMAFTILLSLLYFFQVTGFAAITVAHIPVLVGGVLLGKKYGAFLGTVFGLTAMIFAFFTMGPNAPFTNPLLSVVPRILFGFVTFFVYQAFNEKVKNRPIAIALTMAVSTLIHSLMVIPTLYLFVDWGFYFDAASNPLSNNQALIPFFIAVIGSNTIFEIIVAILVGTPIILAMDNVMYKNITK